MPIVLDIKKDLRYQQGAKEGLEQGLEQGVDKQATITVINMLLETNFSNRKIATLAAVKVPFVVKLEQSLNKYKVKETWDSFDVKDDNKAQIEKRAIATAKLLLKIKTLTDDIIAKICELKTSKIKQLRMEETKK